MAEISRQYRKINTSASEKGELESQLRQAQKMEAIGTLAGGIAHDFNNILTGIIGFTELALSDDSIGGQTREDLNAALKAGHRAKDLVRQILTFSRKQDKDLYPVQIQVLVKETVKMLRATISSSIEIRHHVDIQTGYIMSDPTQIHQLVLNLCTNAAQAMEEETGVLEIRLDEVCLHGDSLNGDPGASARKYARLSISDTGKGIEKDVMERMFEPYFTTKGTGKGSGMGLAMVHGIIENLGGKINVESKPGIGTTFEAYLPICEDSSVIEEEAKTSEPIPTGRGHILLVDDEESIITFARRLLEKLGYQVTGLTNSLEAIQIFRQTPDAFDLVITDQSMPHLQGSDLAVELLRIRKDLPIILCTGFSSTMSEKKAKSIGIRSFLMKPLNLDNLSRTVHQVMNGS